MPVLRMSNLFLRTLREDPLTPRSPRIDSWCGPAWSASGPRRFTWLPLGWIVFRNVERIVREEMDAAGCQEVHFPALLPRALRGDRPVDGVRTEPLPARRPPRQRLSAGTDPRGDVTLVVRTCSPRTGTFHFRFTKSRPSTEMRLGRALDCSAGASS